MTVNLALISVRVGAEVAALRRLLAERSGETGAQGTLIGETLQPNIAGGDLIWRLSFPDRAAWAAAGPALSLDDVAAVAHVDWSAFEPIGEGARGESPAGVYRQMTMHVPPGTDPAAIVQFEDETLCLPVHVAEILRWTLGRVFASGGARRWTHVWEQMFARFEDFTGPYMHHPWHWARVDRWFDPEMPERIVDRRLCNSLCPIAPGEWDGTAA